MVAFAGLLLLGIAAVSATPTPDPVLFKYDDLRYQYMTGPDGTPHLVDLWFKASDAAETARYQPDTQNHYHLFTRANPTVSQPILLNQDGLLGSTNYDARKRTIVIIHGWLDSVTADVNTVLVPAFLSAEDVNVIVVDWSAGGGTINYVAAVTNTVTSGLDPAFPGWITNDHTFRADDGVYTEIIHTNAGLLGYLSTLGQVDFYPNGGINMPGCASQECDHARCYHYLAESLTSGGFTGRRCASYVTAMTGNCSLWGNLKLGGLVPKTGSSGIYYLETNAGQPFSTG